MNKCFDTRRKARRLKSLLEERGVSHFDSHRLGVLHDAIYDCDTHLDELRAGLAQLGNLVVLMSPLVDQVLSFQDKAHVLGTSPERLRKKIDRYSHLAKTEPGFADLVFSYNGEFKSDNEEGTTDSYSEREPLMNAILECMRRGLQEDENFAKAAHTILEDTGMTFYTIKKRSDGTHNLAHRLRVINKPKKPGANSSFFSAHRP